MRHIEREIKALKAKLVELSALADDCVQKAVLSVAKRDASLAVEVIEKDQLLDQTEVEIEEDCLKILALYQPVAADLRFIVASLKINNDLERIGDLASNIAERSLELLKMESTKLPFDFDSMSEKVRYMMRLSLEALINVDEKTAHKILEIDRDVDQYHNEMYQKIYGLIKKSPDQAELLIKYLSISKGLERIADYTTNIGEDVIYLVEGVIVRHGLRAEPSGNNKDTLKQF